MTLVTDLRSYSVCCTICWISSLLPPYLPEFISKCSSIRALLLADSSSTRSVCLSVSACSECTDDVTWMSAFCANDCCFFYISNCSLNSLICSYNSSIYASFSLITLSFPSISSYFCHTLSLMFMISCLSCAFSAWITYIYPCFISTSSLISFISYSNLFLIWLYSSLSASTFFYMFLLSTACLSIRVSFYSSSSNNSSIFL